MNIFEKDLSGEVVSPDDPEYGLLIDDIFSTMEKAQELANVNIRDQKHIHRIMDDILAKHFPKVPRYCLLSISTTASPSVS